MTGLLSSLITTLAGPRPAPAPVRGKPRGIPPPANIRRAQEARMALLAARCAHFDADLLAACATGPRTAVDLARELDTSTARVRRAAYRLEHRGLVRVVRLPYPGQAPVFGVEVCHA